MSQAEVIITILPEVTPGVMPAALMIMSVDPAAGQLAVRVPGPTVDPPAGPDPDLIVDRIADFIN